MSGKPGKESLFGMKLKFGYSKINLLAIPFVYVVSTVASTFTNTSTIFMLRDEEYFNAPKEQIGKISNDLIFYGYLINMPMTIGFGYIFDLAGRKATLLVAFLLMAFFMCMHPFISPNIYPWLIMDRMAFSATLCAAACSPLITDYISRDSRGKATAFVVIGFVVGDLLCFGVIFNFTKSLDPKLSFLIATGCVVALTLVLFMMMKEPVIMVKDNI